MSVCDAHIPHRFVFAGILDHTNKLIQHEVCDVYIRHKFVFATYWTTLTN